jgi:Fe-S-cluster formation regulator IscX/YfhJ
MNDAIAKAFRIGEANAKIVALAQNWCAHLQIQRWGGTGMVEEMTGLPVGTRFFKCDYASATGMAGMDLRHIALDFYDRNCKGCDKRHPVRMPNLGDLVAEREEFAKDQERANSKIREAKTAAYETRREARNEARLNCDEPTAGLIDAIERLDSEGSSEAASVLAEIAKVAPKRFDSRVQSLLFTLAEEADSPVVNEGILETLRLVSTDSQRLCSLALRLLAKHTSSVAADVASHFVGPAHASLIPDALGALLCLAGPDENHFHFLGTKRDPEPTGLLAVYKVAPDLVMEAIKASLSDSQKMSRIRATNAVMHLRDIDPQCGLSLVPLLVASTELPDDKYSIGSAESWVQDLLASMLEHNFAEVDGPVTAAFQRLDSDKSEAGLDQVYLRLFRERRHHEERGRRNSLAHEIIFGRLMNFLSTKCAEQGSIHLLEFLRNNAIHYLDLVERHTDGLLGALAILNEERASAVTSFLQLELPPNPLAALEASRRKQHLYWLVSATSKLLGEAAAQRPGTIGESLLSMLEMVDEEHDNLRASLVEAIGLLAKNRSALPRVLPSLYSALTGRSQLVRAAGIRAYSDVINRSPDDLPPLLHETFMTLLTDLYVIVHSAAVEVLDRHRLPHRYDEQLEYLVFQIIGAHDGSEGNRHVLKTAIEVFLDFQGGKSKQMPNDLCDWIVERIRRCDGHDAGDLLRRHGPKLWHRPAFLQVLLATMRDPEASGYQAEDLLDTLERVPQVYLRPAATDIVDTLKELREDEYSAIDIGIEILTGAGLWSEALSLAEFDQSRWRDTEWDRPNKLLSRVRVLSCAIERFAALGDLVNMKLAINSLRSLQGEREKDEADNAKKRDPLFGLTSSN